MRNNYGSQSSCHYSGLKKEPEGKRLVLPRSCSGTELVKVFVQLGTFDETDSGMSSPYKDSRWIGASRTHHVGYKVDGRGQITYLLKVDAFTRRWVRNTDSTSKWVPTPHYSPVFLLGRLSPGEMYNEVIVFVLGHEGLQVGKDDWRETADWKNAIDHDYFERLISGLGKELGSTEPPRDAEV